MASLSTMALLFAFSLQLGATKPVHVNNRSWSPIKVETTWALPKSKLNPLGIPTSYRWKSGKGATIELTPVKGKWADQVKLTVGEQMIPLSALATLKAGWNPRFGPLIYPCGYNMISETAIPTVERKAMGAFDVYKAEWPNNMNGVPQTCFLIVVLSTNNEDAIALGFEGERVSISLRSNEELLLRATGTSRPTGYMEGWSQAVVVRTGLKRLTCMAKPLASHIPK